ncbi:hypothetical protein TorRG33x02_233320 [Trema orientale]|uniref:Uncharacterized protein n=1 Tax=Trema orientale TaxID=63057 RepID=A0A2P5E5L3_TREOI|nr:hypothetical protein TorRG33x02_233320 [Trema orientale]
MGSRCITWIDCSLQSQQNSKVQELPENNCWVYYNKASFLIL